MLNVFAERMKGAKEGNLCNALISLTVITFARNETFQPPLIPSDRHCAAGAILAFLVVFALLSSTRLN